MSTRKPPQVACPTCARKTEFSPANPWRPFCSEPCKVIDLGAWASNQFVVPGDPVDDAPMTPENGPQ